MSRFLSERLAALKPYTPGEQPKTRKFIKLNTNESPFPPSPKAIEMAKCEVENLMLYSDPSCSSLKEKMAEILNISSESVSFGNGSDEILNFAFMAFCDDNTPIIYPDISYSFYPVLSNLYTLPKNVVPLRKDFTICIDDYKDLKGTVVIANPNAPTGIALSIDQIEELLCQNRDRVVIIDEAYVDFGADSAVSLIDRYDNLLVVQTFSKSRSLAGGRLGMAIGCRELIQDIETIRNSFNPYNINRMTMAAGVGSLIDEEYTRENCAIIIENRTYTKIELEKMGFEVLDSSTNFLFAKTDKVSGDDLYLKLKENGILVRHFKDERIRDFNRITIGSKEEMDAFLDAVRSILKEI